MSFIRGKKLRKDTIPYYVAGIIGIPVMIISMVALFMFTSSAFANTSFFAPNTQNPVIDPSVLFAVDDFFNLINEGKYTTATSRYAYRDNTIITSVDPKIASIFPKDSIEHPEPYNISISGNTATMRLEVYLKDGTVKRYKDELTLHKDMASGEWKIDCSYIDDPSYWR